MHPPSGLPSRFPVALSGLHVLLVEDDPDGRELFAFTLGERGAAVTPVGSAGAALAALDRFRFGAIVSDIGLPDADGYALIASVRARPRRLGGRTPAVAVTAFGDAESRVRALAAGFDTFVPKPVEVDELAGTIAVLARRLAESHRLLDELTTRADVRRSLLARLEALLSDRERVLADARRVRGEARRLRRRPD
jgi:CheY-like chemotaxis protein